MRKKKKKRQGVKMGYCYFCSFIFFEGVFNNLYSNFVGGGGLQKQREELDTFGVEQISTFLGCFPTLKRLFLSFHKKAFYYLYFFYFRINTLFKFI